MVLDELKEACSYLLTNNPNVKEFFVKGNVITVKIKSTNASRVNRDDMLRLLLNTAPLTKSSPIEVGVPSEQRGYRIFPISWVESTEPCGGDVDECFSIANEEVFENWLDCELGLSELQEAFEAGWKDEDYPDFGYEYDYVEDAYCLGKKAKELGHPDLFKSHLKR